jgi:Tfp pilus assembly protein PilX
MKKFQSQHQKGFTLFIALVITATLLLISTGIVALAVRESFLTTASQDSQYAFYAADTGIECAIYWDVKNPSGFSAFATSTSSTISCNQDSNNPNNPAPPQNIVGGSSQSSFTITFLPQPYCATVTVSKPADGSTKIESLGFNTCDTSNPRRVERAVRVTY